MDSGEPQPHDSGPEQQPGDSGPGPQRHESDSGRSASEPVVEPVVAPAVTPVVAETGAQRFARGAHRTLLYFYVVATVVVLIFLIALVVANTSVVKVSWLFGSSSVSLVWLVMGSAILGLFLGMLVGALLRHWTRQPRGSK
jgi:uncharacterized integral membrane protein